MEPKNLPPIPQTSQTVLHSHQSRPPNTYSYSHHRHHEHQSRSPHRHAHHHHHSPSPHRHVHHHHHHSPSPHRHHHHSQSPHHHHHHHHRHSQSPHHHHHHHHRHSQSPHHHHHHHHHYHLEDGELDPAIWKNLPDNILNRVLVRLPLTSLLKLRLVCSSWNSKILSPAIANLRTGLFPHRPGFIRVSAQSSNAGHLQLDFLDRHFHWRKICLGVPPGSIEIEAANAHLLCLSMTFNSLDGFVFKRFLMCNPVTAACKYLPSTLATCYPIIVGMTIDRNTGDYVLVFGGNFKIARGRQHASRTAEVYRSVKGKWNKVPNMPPHVTPVLTSVACGSCLYWLAWDDHEHFGLLRFDVENEQWTWLQTSCDIECYVPWGLMERHGVLYKVGKVSSTINKAYVWELQHDTMEWKVLSEMPEDSETHWDGCVRHCVGHDGAFCSDNSCGHGGLIYKFHDEGEISIYKTPTCPTEEEVTAAAAAARATAANNAAAELQQLTLVAVSGKGKGVQNEADEGGKGDLLNKGQAQNGVSDGGNETLHPIDEGEEEKEGVDEDDDEEFDDASSYASSSYSSLSSGSSYTGSSSEDEELEPDYPTAQKVAPLCSPNMVAPFGHLYVFEPCLGKV
ncbi:hypothetical protein GOP47_0029672 [Adiantum capillus-veneris]|nr:hypothetical protein GOP47_0029672 [Adiantum capillus-veneris]